MCVTARPLGMPARQNLAVARMLAKTDCLVLRLPEAVEVNHQMSSISSHCCKIDVTIIDYW